MTAVTRTVWIVVLVTILAAAVGGWAGVQYGLHKARAPNLDEFLHHELGLTAEQEHRIADLESDFAVRRKVLDHEMQAANRELASSILAEHAYGAGAKAAVERFHRAAASLQEATIIHVLAMRAVLTPEQAGRFDAVISGALTSDQP